jgi:hypothetical protein
VIDGVKRQLHQQVQTAFDRIARLTEAKQQLIRVRYQRNKLVYGSIV